MYKGDHAILFSFIESNLTYSKLQLYVIESLISFDICIYPYKTTRKIEVMSIPLFLLPHAPL